MSKILAELLGEDNPLFGSSISRLEKACGNPSIDVKLISDIATKVRIKTKSLGLDPSDSTGKELYHALISLVKKHEEFFIKRIGGKQSDDLEELTKKIILTIDKIKIPKKVWVIKLSSTKRLLKSNPPKTTMKYLGYRSIESMIKREPIYELMACIRLVEDESWLKNFINKYKTLAPTDYETRNIQIVVLDSKKWADAAKKYVGQKHLNTTNLKEIGAVYILPVGVKQTKGLALATFYQVIKYINEIRTYSSYFKMQQVKPNFGQIYVNTLTEDPGKHASIAGNDLHWRIIQKHFGKLDDDFHPEIFQPHVQLEDLNWKKVEDILYELEPALHFWFDMEYVASLCDGLPVSFNLIDCLICNVNELSYEKRYFSNFRESLRNELLTRYVGEDNLKSQVLKQLDNDTSMCGINNGNIKFA